MTEAFKKGYIGNEGQLVTLRRVTIDEGKARGTQVIEVATAGGLSVDILPDNGLDIGQVRFRGRNMTFITKNGLVSPERMLPYENEFLHYFPGGLVYTCGLRSAGPANRDGDEWHPLHGRYHGTPAEQVAARVEDGHVVIAGVVRDTALFGQVLELKRTISIGCEDAVIEIRDEVSNLAPRDEEIMMVYHCNFGYPLLSETAELTLPEARETLPRTEFARQGLNKTTTFEPPVDNEEERCFFQKMKDEFHVTLSNSAISTRMDMEWSGDTLPIMVEWRSMASGDYALGLEPSNSTIMGRRAQREDGTLPVLKAGETIENRVRFAFSDLC